VNSSKIIFPVVVLLLLVFYTLKFFDVIYFSLVELAAFIFCFWGFKKAVDGFSFIDRSKVFFGTIIFLSSLTVIILYHFEFFTLQEMILPAVLMILGGGFLMLFLTSTDNIMLAFVSAVLFGFSLLIVIKSGRVDLVLFLKNLWELILNLWYLFLLLFGIVYLLNRK
jgi:hypothetical protein